MGFFKKALSMLLIGSGVLSLAACAEEKPAPTPTPTPSENTPSDNTPSTTPSTETPSESGSIKDQFDCISLADAAAKGTAAGDAGTTEKYHMYGKIEKITSTTHGNMVITDGTNTLFFFGTYDKDGTTKYGEMTDKPVVGDEVVIESILGTYNGKPQGRNGIIKAFKHVAGGETPSTTPSTKPSTTKPSTTKPTDSPMVTPDGEVALTVNFNENPVTEKTEYLNDQTLTFGGKEFFFSGYYAQPDDNYGPACTRFGGKNPVALTKLGLDYKGYYLECNFDTEAVKGMTLECIKSYSKYEGWEVLFKETGSDAYTSIATGTGTNISASLAEAKNGRFVIAIKGAQPRLDLDVFKLYK